MSTLNETMVDIADAIREKKGTSDKIAPINFAEEIRGITAGGGGSGESSWKYYDVTMLDTSQKSDLSQIVVMAKVLYSSQLESLTGSGEAVVPIGVFAKMSNSLIFAATYAFALDLDMRILMGGRNISVVEYLGQFPFYGSLIEITKEQFYSLE